MMEEALKKTLRNKLDVAYSYHFRLKNNGKQDIKALGIDIRTVILLLTTQYGGGTTHKIKKLTETESKMLAWNSAEKILKKYNGTMSDLSVPITDWRT